MHYQGALLMKQGVFLDGEGDGGREEGFLHTPVISWLYYHSDLPTKTQISCIWIHLSNLSPPSVLLIWYSFISPLSLSKKEHASMPAPTNLILLQASMPFPCLLYLYLNKLKLGCTATSLARKSISWSCQLGHILQWATCSTATQRNSQKYRHYLPRVITMQDHALHVFNHDPQWKIHFISQTSTNTTT